MDHLADSSLNSLTLEESYRHIGLAFNADSSFNLSFDSAILKNLSHWLGLQTLAKGIPVSAEALPLLDIVITASHRGPQDLLFAVPFVAQIFMAASSSMAFQPSLPCFRELLSLLARLHGYPHMGLQCILEIEIHLSLQLSDFQSSFEHWFSLSNAALNAVMEKEGQMHADDKRQIEKAKARNAVEEYVYRMKDKLETVYKEFISKQDKKQILRLLNDTEDWLYKEGDNEIRQFITRSSRNMVIQYLGE